LFFWKGNILSKSRILKETAWIVGIALCLGGLFKILTFSPLAVFTTFVSPFLLWGFMCEKLMIEWTRHFNLVLVLSVAFEAVVIRSLFFYALKFKWKLLAGLVALILFGSLNYGAGYAGLYLMLKPHWQTYKNDAFHFSMDTPYRMVGEQDDKPLKDDAGRVYITRQFDMEHFGMINLCRVNVHCIEYAYRRPSLERIKSIWKKMDEKAKISSVVCSGIPALLIDRDNGYWLEVSKGNYSWSFIIGTKNYYEEYYQANVGEMANRIIKSIQIKDVP
jgi:hypothetical protein